MKKLLSFSFFYVFSTVAIAEIQVQIQPQQVSMDHSFRLVLTIDNLQNGSIPDLTPLQKDFIVLNTEQRMNYSIINGQSQSSTEWILTLKALKDGDLIIPIIKVGQEETVATTIHISSKLEPQSNTQNTIDKPTSKVPPVYMTTQINKKKPYIHQEIIYKVTLYNSQRLFDARYQTPQIDNALLIPLGEANRHQIEKNNRPYLVEEQNYAVFPQKSGLLKIKSPVLTALINEFNPQHIEAKDTSRSLEVQPIPKQYSRTDWLPAREVKLTEYYEDSRQQIPEGNTLVRTVILEGVGIPAQLLPKLSFTETDNFHIYPEKDKDINQLYQGKLIGHNEYKITYLFNKAGKISLPELKLTWFNTETNKEEIASLPQKVLEITPSGSASSEVKNNETPIKEEISPQIAKTHAVKHTNISWAWLIAIFSVITCLSFLIFFKKQKSNRDTSLKSSLKNLHQASLKGDPKTVQKALLQWARLHWNDNSLLNLTDLTHLTTDSFFQKQINLLSQALYKNQKKSLWRGEELWQSISALRKTKSSSKNREVLPPINP